MAVHPSQCASQGKEPCGGWLLRRPSSVTAQQREAGKGRKIGHASSTVKVIDEGGIKGDLKPDSAVAKSPEGDAPPLAWTRAGSGLAGRREFAAADISKTQ